MLPCCLAAVADSLGPCGAVPERLSLAFISVCTGLADHRILASAPRPDCGADVGTRTPTHMPVPPVLVLSEQSTRKETRKGVNSRGQSESYPTRRTSSERQSLSGAYFRSRKQTRPHGQARHCLQTCRAQTRLHLGLACDEAIRHGQLLLVLSLPPPPSGPTPPFTCCLLLRPLPPLYFVLFFTLVRGLKRFKASRSRCID